MSLIELEIDLCYNKAILEEGVKMKYLIIPKNLKCLEEYQKNGAEGFILGILNYSINYEEITLEELKKISTKYPIWVAMNKSIRNEELKDVERILEELSTLSIEGVLFYDLSILSIVQRKKLNIQLVWHQTHMVTNCKTCEYYWSQGVKYGFISNEITLEEILEIKRNTKMKLMVQVVGYPIMSHSRRRLIDNYFKDIDKKSEKEVYQLTEKNSDTLLIRENQAGTTILFGKPMNGTRALYDLLENEVDYTILDMHFLEDSTGIEVLKLYQEIKDTYKKDSTSEREEKINCSYQLLGDFTNFFYRKTIYKVKRG